MNISGLSLYSENMLDKITTSVKFKKKKIALIEAYGNDFITVICRLLMTHWPSIYNISNDHVQKNEKRKGREVKYVQKFKNYFFNFTVWFIS